MTPYVDPPSAGRALDQALSAARVEDSTRRDLELAVRASVAGGIAACGFYGGALDVVDKGENDPVTAADHASNRSILALLQAEAPADPILSEESPPPDGDRRTGRLWVVDPLDGTKEFIAQNGEFSIMVGLAQDGYAVLGAVYQPAIERVFVGAVGTGAWALSPGRDGWRSESLSLDPEADLALPIRFVRSRSHPDERLARLAADLHDIEEVISGSVGIKCALVARGAADLYVHPVPYLNQWDTCAPEAILRGAGGRVTDCAGDLLRYGADDPRQRGGIFAATPAAWAHTRSAVQHITRPMFQDRE